VNRRLPAALLGVAALTAVLVLGNGTAAFAATVTGTDGDYSFTVDNADIPAGATITGYTGGSAANIPDSVTLSGQTYAVTSIGADAFYLKSLTSATIPNSVTSIGDEAFFLNAVTSVTIGDSVTSIGAKAFSNNALTSATIPNSVTSIGAEAFASNPLTSVDIGDSVTSIGADAFYENDLTTVTIPDSVTSIGATAFYSNALTTVTIGDSVTNIGNLAFYNNPGLARVEFLGAAPITIGAAGVGSSLGTGIGLTVYYNWAFDAAQTAGGFTTPTWQGYTTVEQATVAFDSSGHGTAPAAQDVTVGSAATKPADPTATGYVFTGWYTSPALTTPANFTDPITANTTYYAGWTTLATTGVTVNPLALLLTGLTLLLGLALVLITRRKAKPTSQPGTPPLG
jgi:uncharacterized repeat protein (TIGR02543 family)